MFSTQLRRARLAEALSVAEVADMAHTSRAAISQYESGAKLPRIDTADRVLRVLGKRLAVVDMPRRTVAYLRPELLGALNSRRSDAASEIRIASDNLPTILEADARIERLDVTWGQVKTVMGGTTVAGDELSVWRLWELRASLVRELRSAKSGIEPELRTVTSNTVVEVRDGDPVKRVLTFLSLAIEAGEDPDIVRHRVGAFLAHHGYPWIWAPYKRAEDYRRAIVACKRSGDGNPLASVMLESISGMER